MCEVYLGVLGFYVCRNKHNKYTKQMTVKY
jgi:hypothetical protein